MSEQNLLWSSMKVKLRMDKTIFLQKFCRGVGIESKRARNTPYRRGIGVRLCEMILIGHFVDASDRSIALNKTE